MTKKAEKTDELIDKVNELEGQLKRAVADYHNLERRITEGRSEYDNWAKSNLVGRILSVSDNLDKVIIDTPDQERSSNWFKGIEMVARELRKILEEDGGLKVMTVTPFIEDFDPSKHEAIDVQEGDDGKILKVMKNGFVLNDKVVRPAQVVVGRRDVIASAAKQSPTDEEIAASHSAPRNDKNEEGSTN